MKMRTEKGKWIIEDGNSNIIFDKAYDAWGFILLMKEVRTNPPVPYHSLYPVRTLIPTIARGGKKIVYSGL